MIVLHGREYGTATEIAARLTSPERRITAETIRDWARRSTRPGDRLHGRLPRYNVAGRGRGTTRYSLHAAAHVEALTSTSPRVQGMSLDAGQGKIAS